MRILHVTVHLGGGIGTVVSGVCIRDRKNEHSILCLEECQDRRRLEECIREGISVYQWNDVDVSLLEQFDIIQAEWWHHPLTSEFMVRQLGKVKTRLVIWSHISGCNYPVIPYPFLSYPEAFVFATPYSYDNPYWTEEERRVSRQKAMLAVSSGNDFTSEPPEKAAHPGFCMGYVGFLGYEKTSPEFVHACERCGDIPDITFRVVGDLQYGQELYREAMDSSCRERFDFRGFSSDVSSELTQFDVFACLLQKEHTGASENALLEAMYHRVCPVVFRQCTEQYLVKHMETGLVCDGMDEFVEGVHLLARDRELSRRLSSRASDYVRSHYSIGHTVGALDHAYHIAMGKDKRFHPGNAVFGDTPAQWFLSCCRQDPKQLTGLAAGKSKASVNQYYQYFNDKELAKIIQENTE